QLLLSASSSTRASSLLSLSHRISPPWMVCGAPSGALSKGTRGASFGCDAAAFQPAAFETRNPPRRGSVPASAFDLRSRACFVEGGHEGARYRRGRLHRCGLGALAARARL